MSRKDGARRGAESNFYSHGGYGTRLYKIWSGMKERCYRPAHSHYANYGGRGIKVCDEWKNDFATFREWAETNGYADDLTIDRKDANGDYSPQNCRWVTMKEQQNNRRNNRKIECNGESHTIAEWAEITGIGNTTISQRLRRGWAVEPTLTIPPAYHHNGVTFREG